MENNKKEEKSKVIKMLNMNNPEDVAISKFVGSVENPNKNYKLTGMAYQVFREHVRDTFNYMLMRSFPDEPRFHAIRNHAEIILDSGFEDVIKIDIQNNKVYFNVDKVALNTHFEFQEGFELYTRAMCHEISYLIVTELLIISVGLDSEGVFKFPVKDEIQE